MKPFTFAAVVKYTSAESVGGNSDTDIALGYTNSMLGSNRSIAKMGVLAIVVNEKDRGYIALVRKRLDPQDSVWKSTDPGVKTWKHVFEAVPVTELMDLPKGPWRQVDRRWMNEKDHGHRTLCGNMMLQMSKHRRDDLLVKVLLG